jgi:hypothetical protein
VCSRQLTIAPFIPRCTVTRLRRLGRRGMSIKRGPEMTKQQRRETAARFATLAIGWFVVAARLGNGIDGRRVRRG